MYCKPLNLSSIFKKLDKLNILKSPGPAMIHRHMVQSAAASISSYIVQIKIQITITIKNPLLGIVQVREGTRWLENG